MSDINIDYSVSSEIGALSQWFADASKCGSDNGDVTALGRLRLEQNIHAASSAAVSDFSAQRESAAAGIPTKSTLNEVEIESTHIPLPFKPIIYEAKVAPDEAGVSSAAKGKRRSTAFKARGLHIQDQQDRVRVNGPNKSTLIRRMSGIVQSFQEKMPKIQHLIKRANEEDCKAQYELAVRFLEGNGVSKDIERYVYWLHQAANYKHTIAANNLAVMYASGIYVDQDNNKALQYFTIAAEGGMARAMLQVALLHYQGFDQEDAPTRDYDAALSWYRRAVECGSRTAKNNLAAMYLVGHGVNQDFVTAAALFQEAADEGDASAEFNLAQMIKHGLSYSKGGDQHVAASLASKTKIAMPLPDEAQ